MKLKKEYPNRKGELSMELNNWYQGSAITSPGSKKLKLRHQDTLDALKFCF